MKRVYQVSVGVLGVCISTAFANVPVQSIGALKNIHQGKTDATILLTELKQEGLQAIGPVGNKDGEITIIDGKPYISQIREGDVITRHDWDVGAGFLVWSNVNQWQQPVALGADVKTLTELDQQITKLAEAAKIDTQKPFAFKLSGHFHHVKYHILNGASGKSAASFTAKHLDDLEAIGFYSTQHQGVFTHKNQLTHVHIVLPNQVAGHIDELYVPHDKLMVQFPQRTQ